MTRPLDLDELDALCAGATPGPWVHTMDPEGFATIEANGRALFEPTIDAVDDAAFCAASRTAIPQLCAALRETRAAVEGEVGQWMERAERATTRAEEALRLGESFARRVEEKDATIAALLRGLRQWRANGWSVGLDAALSASPPDVQRVLAALGEGK